MVPATTRFALLVEPNNPTITEPTVRDVEAAARAMGLQMRILHANTSREIGAAFATFVHDRPDALFVAPSAFFNARRVQLAHWATHYRLPATYSGRQNVEAGGLMSYGASVIDAHRQMGVYAGHILKGAKIADLPVRPRALQMKVLQAPRPRKSLRPRTDVSRVGGELETNILRVLLRKCVKYCEAVRRQKCGLNDALAA
jgi:ABC-type uncharacterized transport system substrate-binding protein